MDIRERIKEVQPYFDTMKVETYDGNQLIFVKTIFSDKWSVPDDTASKFNIKIDPDNDGLHYFFWTEFESGFDILFDAIDYVVKINKDVEYKAQLYKEKLGELKAFFYDDRYTNEDLESIQFIIKPKKKGKKDSKTEMLESVETEESNITENNINE